MSPSREERLTPGQESFLLGLKKTINATRYDDRGDQREFLDRQAQILVCYNPFHRRGV
jgi:hypothetical protein